VRADVETGHLDQRVVEGADGKPPAFIRRWLMSVPSAEVCYFFLAFFLFLILKFAPRSSTGALYSPVAPNCEDGEDSIGGRGRYMVSHCLCVCANVGELARAISESATAIFVTSAPHLFVVTAAVR
jgi:hypothetical protein